VDGRIRVPVRVDTTSKKEGIKHHPSKGHIVSPLDPSFSAIVRVLYE
jgi:hypothetical protein